jgi:hypothetical protein
MVGVFHASTITTLIAGTLGMTDVILKRFDTRDEVRTMEKGKFEIVRIGRMTIGRATYEPGWKWSLHVRRRVGASRCTVEHMELVIVRHGDAGFDDPRLSNCWASCFTFRRFRTTVGWWATNPTFHSIS